MSKTAARRETLHGNVLTYTIGFILSMIFTLGAYLIVHAHVASQHFEFSHELITVVIFALAIGQLLVQLFFFLHLGQEPKPRWNLMIFLFMVLVLVVLVFGSLWIMGHLDYHNMTPSEEKLYLHNHEGF